MWPFPAGKVAAKNTAYRCRNCGHEFEISLRTDLIRPHGIGNGGWKYLECPQCGRGPELWY